MRRVVEESVAAVAAVGAPVTWVLSSHDAIRPVTRYGGGPLGERRARAAALLMLALPGAVYLFQGEELGLEQVELPDDRLRDPVWERSGHRAGARRLPGAAALGRRRAALLLQQRGRPTTAGPPAGRLGGPHRGGPAGRPGFRTRSVPGGVASAQTASVPARRALGLEGPGSWLGFRRGGTLRCVLNFGPGPLMLGDDARILLASTEFTGRAVPPDTAVWTSPIQEKSRT